MKKIYPGIKEAEEEKRRAAQKTMYDNEPDIIQCAGGFCPNYKKFESKGISDERALILCNMD